MPKILFYRPNEIPYGVFSNFDTRHIIEVNGKFWPSTEHFFQAMKFEGTEHEEIIRNLAKPRFAAEYGRRRDILLREDWEQVKDDFMRQAIRAKFTQHQDAATVLLSTKDAELVEHTVNDAYWADGGDGTGKNMLGKILMEVREEIRNK